MNFELTKEEKETKRLMLTVSAVIYLLVYLPMYMLTTGFLVEILNIQQSKIIYFAISIAMLLSLIYTLIDKELDKYWKQPYHDRLQSAKDLNEHFKKELPKYFNS